MPFKGIPLSRQNTTSRSQFSLGRTNACSRLYSGLASLVLFHPDYTVGSGIAPDLLPSAETEALAGSRQSRIPPVGNYTPP